ncbi:hypothetical protein SUGI_1198240 [Cryptomeria japonica]|uniref:E3 ubiquitin-protein ligase PUB23 n=1 Tax=Cryptomeria japonica TaxID=3369 RepID=UPI0024147B85|nr:E3 ubiquitin-protein ligase PUB23 [Cryptomeria japonica]GLJ55808.1 hypothetical protein SUGI_1198240 [Cryptomeria japonica]
MEAAEVEIPSYFLCPISIQLMKDPVTICTGVTYDRQSIEKWMFTLGNNTCPLTRQHVHSTDLTPNHTLLRLIQQWCDLNSSKGVDRISTPPPPLDADQLHKLLRDIESSPAPAFQAKALKKLRSVAGESEGNRQLIALSDAPAALVFLIENHSAETDEAGCCYEIAAACEEALGILYSLPLRDKTLDSITTAGCLPSVAYVLKRGTSNARFHAAMLLQSVSTKVLERFVMNANEEIIEGLLEMLTEEVCHQATMAALNVLTAMSNSSRRSRKKAIEAGAVSALIELLPDQTVEKKNICERMLCLLDVLCGCAEGRAAMADHAMGIAAVSKKIIRVSPLATEKAVRIVWSLCKCSPSKQIINEVVQIGAVAKLCMLMHSECTPKTKSKAKEMLRVHDKFWRNSSCVPSIIYPKSVL